MFGHVLSDLGESLLNCVSLAPAGATAWIRQVDSLRDQAVLIEWMEQSGVRSLSREHALFDKDAISTLSEQFTFFTEVWLFSSMPRPEALRSVPEIWMTADMGLITERPQEAREIEYVMNRIGAIVVLGDGDGLNYCVLDNRMVACVAPQD